MLLRIRAQSTASLPGLSVLSQDEKGIMDVDGGVSAGLQELFMLIDGVNSDSAGYGGDTAEEGEAGERPGEEEPLLTSPVLSKLCGPGCAATTRPRHRRS